MANYIEKYVYELSGVKQKRNFDENGNSVDPDFTYGDIKTSLTQRNINKDLNIHKDRVKKIHREAMNIRDTSDSKGQIWTRMDQDDPRMGRYNFPNKPDYPVGDETNKLQYGRDITDVINAGVSNDDIKALREFLTKNTIAPEYNKWIKYGTEKPPYGFELDQSQISSKINEVVPDHDTQNNEVDINSSGAEHDYKRSVNIDTIDTPFTLEKGLAADKLNIYSYVKVISSKNSTNVSKTYYYIPFEPFNFTDTVAETGNEGQYYRRYYERYHIVNSKVNSLRDDNSLRYSYSNGGSNFDLANLGNEFIFDINTNDTATTDIDSTLDLNGINIEYGDYFREYSKKKWKIHGTTAPTNGRRLRLNSTSDVVTWSEITSTTTGFTFDKNLSNEPALNNIYLTNDDYFIYNDSGTDYYIVSAEPGRTVWMITKSATKENEDKATLQTEVRDVRNEAMNVRDSLSTEPSQLWLKMNRNDPRNSQYLYPELTPIYWSSNGNIKPEMGRDLENVLDTSNFSTLKNYVVDDSYSIDTYYTCNLSLEPIYFYDYLNANYSNYYTIDYDKSRKVMGMGISSVVSNFLIGTPSSNNYILNSKIDTKTQNVLMDSLLEKQYGDLYVMNVASVTSNDARIKPGDYYIEPAEEDYVFGRVWVKTNLNKKLDFGRELYDSELTEILKSEVYEDDSQPVSSSHTLATSNFTTKFTTTDLANLGIKSLDYIYVCTNITSNEDYYFKAMPNTNGIYDGRKWDEVVVGAKPDESFGRQLYHQNLSEKLHTTNEIILDANYSNLNLDKLNLDPSNYILDRDNDKSYRPKPIDIWLSVRSTENQHVYNKHRQESVSDNKYIAQDVRQNSDVPGQIWKKMTASEAENLKFDYGAITPLAWETTSNGEIEPKKGRNLNEYLSGNTDVLDELRDYIDSQVFDLDTFNTYTNLSDFSDNGGFNHDDYILVDKNSSNGNLSRPHKYYTINYNVSRNLNTTRDGTDKRLNIHTSKTNDELIKFLTENNFENYSENYNYPYKKYYVDILNSTRDSKTNIITKYGDEYILLDHRDVPNREDDASNIATLVPNNIKYGDYYKDTNGNAWVAIRSHKKQKEYDDNTNYNEVRTLAKRKRSESTTVGDIWIKMKKTDPRFSKYNYENLNVSSSRDISTLSSSFKDFLEKNINLTDGSEQISFVLDSKVDFRTNRITEYGNEYVVTFNNDTYNSGTSPGPGYGQYHKKETNDYGDTWYSIGTKKPDKGRLIVSQEITDLIKAQIDIPSWQGINEILINVYATETAKSGNNSEDITVLQFLKDFNLTDDDYIKADIDSTPYYFRPKPHDLWVVTRSLDEQAKYDEKIRIKYRDVYQEAKAIRQSSKTIGQIWIQVDSLEDPRISKDKYPHRRALSTNTITGQLQTLLNNYTTKPYTADSGDSNISEFQREIYKSDGSSMVLDYVQNRFYVVDSDIDMATYQIKYDDSQDPLSVRSGLGKELVILDKNKIPNIDSDDHDSVIIDGKDMGQILRYGDYYSSGGKYYVVSRSYDEEHAKDLADQALKDLERANQNELDSNTLLNTYLFSDTDDRYGRLWQKVTTLDGYIISSNQKILKHTFAENSLESDGYTLKLTNTELDNLLSDFTMTEVLSTKYIKHPTKNQYFVTTNYGTTWEKHESLPEVGTEIFIKRDDPDGGTPTYFTSKDTVSPTSANNFGYTGDNVDDSTVTLSDDVEVLKLLLFNGLIDKYYIQNTSGNYYETDNVYNITAQTITWNKVDSIPLDKKILRTITSDVDSKLTSSSPTISVTEYEALLVANDYNSWAEHNSRKRHFVTQYIHKSGTNYYISNDGGYNWREIDNLNKVHNNTIYSYGIFHDTTKNILDSGRTLLTTDELDDLLNNAKYSASHKISTVEFSFADTTEYDTAEPYIVQEADNTIPINIASDFDVVYINIDDKYYYPNDDTALNWTVTLTEPTGTGRTKYIIQSSTPFKSRLINDGDTALGTLTGDLNSQYVSHRLLTNQHYLTDGSNHYIPQPLVNEDYKNYINMPGKGKLGKYWKLRYVVDAPTPTLTEITVNGSAAKQAIRDILEGNDNDINRYQYNKERLTLTKEERDVIAGGELVAITQNNYISHSVKPNYNYMSNDNGYNWFKVHNVSDSSVKLIQLEQDRDYNGNDIDLGNILYKIYTEDTGYGSYGSFDNKASNEFYINDNVFDNYEVEKYVRENGYIQHTVSNVIYTFVPGEYINENYNYFSADNEYPAKNTLGRIWNILGITPNGNGGLYTDADTTKFDKLKELLYSKNILDIDLNSNDFIINLSTTTNIYYQATDNKFYYPADATGTSWVRTTTRPEDKLEFRLDFTPPDNSANDTFNNALINSATTTITIQATEYTSIKIDLDSTRNVYYKVVDTSDTYYYIPTDENKRRWYAQKDVPINSLRIVQNGGFTSDSLSSQLIERTNTNMNMKGTNPTVTLSYEEYALYVKPSIIAIDKYIQIGNKFYVPGRLINDYQDNFYLPVP